MTIGFVIGVALIMTGALLRGAIKFIFVIVAAIIIDSEVLY